MTADEFRSLALSLPQTEERSHMEHPDFRLRNKIFATLGPGEAWGMVKFTPSQQREFIDTAPATFTPIPGGWGERGATKVLLESATEAIVHRALVAAWRNVAPAKLLPLLSDE